MSLQPITSHPDVAAYAGEIDRLNRALSKVRGRLYEISVLQSAPAVAAADAGKVAAAIEFAESGGQVRAGTLADGLGEEQRVLREQEAALVRAVSDRMQARDALTAELSRALTLELIPKHKTLAKEYLRLLERLDELVELEAQMAVDASIAGYEVRFSETLHDVHLGRIGDSSGSRLYYRTRELRRYLG